MLLSRTRTQSGAAASALLAICVHCGTRYQRTLPYSRAKATLPSSAALTTPLSELSPLRPVACAVGKRPHEPARTTPSAPLRSSAADDLVFDEGLKPYRVKPHLP